MHHVRVLKQAMPCCQYNRWQEVLKAHDKWSCAESLQLQRRCSFIRMARPAFAAQDLDLDDPILEKPELLRFVKKKAQLKVRHTLWYRGGRMARSGHPCPMARCGNPRRATPHRMNQLLRHIESDASPPFAQGDSSQCVAVAPQ